MRRSMTAVEREAVSRRMKAAWRRRKRLDRQTPTTTPSPNGAVTIPYALAKLLAAQPSDYQNPIQYEEVRAIGQQLLRLLLSVEAQS